MAESVFRGPVTSIGALMDTSISPFDGPAISYQCGVFPDPRNSPAAKDGLQPARIPGFFVGSNVTVIDQIPSTGSTTTIAAAQVATSGTAMSLATTSAGGAAAGTPSWTYGVPIIPNGTTVAVTVGAIDFGFTTGTTAASSSTVVLVDNSVVTQGQWLVIGGAGNAAKTLALVTRVMSTLSNGTGILVSPVCAGAVDNAPIGQGNLFGQTIPPGTQFGPASASANAAIPYRDGGFALVFDPVQAIARNITVQAASVTGGTATILVAGYDIYNRAMTELLTASGTTLVAGKKAFKYVASVTPTASGISNYTIGVGEAVGLPLRADRFGSIRVTMGNNVMATAAGFTTAVTSVATNTTGDVRGALVLNTLGGAIGTSNGTSRLTVWMEVPFLSVRNATPAASTSLFGVAQA